MLRQIHIFLESELLFVKDYARALGHEELNNVKQIIQKYIDMPIPGKTFQRPVSNFQIFHRAAGNLYFLFITDLIDSLQYIEEILLKTIEKFRELFPNPKDDKESIASNEEFNNILNQIQKDLHSKIVIIGPEDSGKTTLYDILKSGEERIHMNFAKTSTFEIEEICFDLWDFLLRDNFSLLWSKFIHGSDLVIFVFNLANYNLRIIDHFLKLKQLEGSYSKFLILGNKRDLVEDADIRRIKNEIGVTDFIEISLNTFEAKSQVTKLIIDILELKRKLPQNFGELIKEADNLGNDGKNVQALAKYKELITISRAYQNIIFTKALNQKITEMNKKIQLENERRRELESKKGFEVAKPLVFTRKITVKPLPKTESSDQIQDEQPIVEEESPPPSKEIQKMVSFQKLDTEKLKTTLKVPKIQLKAFKKPLIPQEKKVITPTKDKSKMPFEIFTKPEVQDSKIETPMVIDFVRELQKLIIEKGSSLSLKLCENLITELEVSLGRPVTLDDIRLAADFFVKQEQLS